jgi:formyltetrahydrofolate hydrolase
MSNQFVLVHAIISVPADRGCDIVESRQFDDHDTGQLFLRM